jgi:hypothetical protein
MCIAICASCGVPIVLEAPDDPADDKSALVSRLGVYLVPHDTIAPTVAMVRLHRNQHYYGSVEPASLHPRATWDWAYLWHDQILLRVQIMGN